MLSAQQIQKRTLTLLAQEKNNTPKLWWLSFCDPTKPKGQQFLGVCIVEVPGFIHAQQKTWTLGINPGGEIQACQVEDVPPEYLDKLLSRAELEAAGFV